MEKEQHAPASLFGHGAIAPRSFEWPVRAVRPERWSKARKYAARAISAFVWVLCSLAGVAVYTNVLQDDAALRERIDRVARQHAGCGDQCRITRMQGRRSVLDYRADYDFDGVGTVSVICRREAIVLGAHECRAR